MSAYARFQEPAAAPLPDYSRVEFWHLIEQIEIGADGYFTARVKVEGTDDGHWIADPTWFQVQVNCGTSDDDFESLDTGAMDRWFKQVIARYVGKQRQAISDLVQEAWARAQ